MPSIVWMQVFEKMFPTSLGGNLWCEYGILSPEKPWVVLVHGLGEHAKRHAYLPRWAQDHEMNFLRYDLRGHGRSSSLPGGRFDFSLFRQELREVLTLITEEGGREYVFLGHSLGGLIVCDYLQHQRDLPPQGAFLSSPFYSPGGWRGKLFHLLPQSLLSLMARTPWSWPLRGLINPRDLFSSPKLFTQYQEDADIRKKTPLHLLLAMLIQAKKLTSLPLNYEGVLRGVVGEQDVVVSPHQAQKYFKNCRPSRGLCIIPSRHHELFHREEQEGDIFWTKFTQFVGECYGD